LKKERHGGQKPAIGSELEGNLPVCGKRDRKKGPQKKKGKRPNCTNNKASCNFKGTLPRKKTERKVQTAALGKNKKSAPRRSGARAKSVGTVIPNGKKKQKKKCLCLQKGKQKLGWVRSFQRGVIPKSDSSKEGQRCAKTDKKTKEKRGEFRKKKKSIHRATGGKVY